MAVYFAYGRMMHPDEMETRCPGAKCLGPAFMDGYRFIITSEGTHSMVQAPGKRVHGVLWDLRIAHVTVVDSAEALFRRAQDKVLLPVRCGNITRNAIVYFGKTSRTGKPHAKAWDKIVPAAEHWKFPAQYIDELKKWGL
ncbi:gamma-glutamylcyclotransferase family protein [Pseudovibrio sp. SPO723]|uniref:gamma-glutamylcyclotransferase family protein n=1 Tax=Nesiotobacter zosterae TaxID=392721 RepID=UPI0029C3822F|nr:gamma-glutamylcyclotransferase family protein [Pseudovibrio sp. SPO723]MDX5594501.1 gamma-glutamylcyclotransferase family protein [Pseudovibrio sp. SPO723]